MPQELLDRVRELFAAFNAGDIDSVVAAATDDAEIVVPPEASAEPDVYRGQDGLRRYWESFNYAMEDIRFEAEAFWESGEDLVVATCTTARGRQTGIAVEQHITAVWSFRDGKVRRILVFASRERALASVGLAADAAPAPA
jgi:ketosteroid isomerase-like protein